MSNEPWRNAEPETIAALRAANARLDAELEETADKLSSCWIFLDALARSELPAYGEPEMAAELLRKQKAPGWKE